MSPSRQQRQKVVVPSVHASRYSTQQQNKTKTTVREPVTIPDTLSYDANLYDYAATDFGGYPVTVTVAPKPTEGQGRTFQYNITELPSHQFLANADKPHYRRWQDIGLMNTIIFVCDISGILRCSYPTGKVEELSLTCAFACEFPCVSAYNAQS